jgi:hypothetical protein
MLHYREGLWELKTITFLSFLTQDMWLTMSTYFQEARGLVDPLIKWVQFSLLAGRKQAQKLGIDLEVQMEES